MLLSLYSFTESFFIQVASQCKQTNLMIQGEHDVELKKVLKLKSDIFSNWRLSKHGWRAVDSYWGEKKAFKKLNSKHTLQYAVSLSSGKNVGFWCQYWLQVCLTLWVLSFPPKNTNERMENKLYFSLKNSPFSGDSVCFCWPGPGWKCPLFELWS